MRDTEDRSNFPYFLPTSLTGFLVKIRMFSTEIMSNIKVQLYKEEEL